MFEDVDTMIDLQEGLQILVRLAVAMVIGGLIGFERDIHGRFAGLRTHMTVALGACIFAIAGLGVAPAPLADATRVIQGVTTGIGFLGAGTILKLSDQLEVKGLTTASAIWLTAALGTAAGLGQWWLASIGVGASLLVLWLLRPLEKWVHRDSD